MSLGSLVTGTVRSDRRWRFAYPAGELWPLLTSVEDYPRWWPWLTEFEADGVRPGSVWRCAVRPPLPYTLRFAVVLQDVQPPRLLTATVEGDIGGAATLEVIERDGGSEVRLQSSLAPTRRPFAVLAAIARPLARRGHDWVLDTGAAQFAAALHTASDRG